jgi:hypothetical protein
MRTTYPQTVKVNYLAISGNYVTPNATQGRTAEVITGPLAATTVSDPLLTANHKELAINLTIQSVNGTSPTLDIYLDVLDPIEPQNSNVAGTGNAPVASLKLNASSITTPLNLRAVIAGGYLIVYENNTPGTPTQFSVPMRWQVRFVIAGTNPSYSIIATYEARE